MSRTVSIIVPCYNEAQTIGVMLTRLASAPLGGWEREVIIVDDASTDETRDILKKYQSTTTVISLKENGGKGTAVRAGLACATGDFVLIQDADLEYDPLDIHQLLAVVEKGDAEVVYGSRNLSPETRRGGVLAYAGVWLITKLINLLYGLALTDVWTCYKLFPLEAAGDFLAGRFESELLFTAALARRGYRFAEVPISYVPRDVSEGKKIRYRDGLYAIIVVVTDWLQTARIVRFLISGAAGLSVNLGLFHMLYVLGVPYLAGSIAAVLFSMIVGFLLQKYWTFEERTSKRVHTQFALYVALALGNLAVNTLIVYLLVEYLGAHYLIAQTVGAGLVALVSYFVYKHYIFRSSL